MRTGALLVSCPPFTGQAILRWVAPYDPKHPSTNQHPRAAKLMLTSDLSEGWASPDKISMAFTKIGHCQPRAKTESVVTWQPGDPARSWAQQTHPLLEAAMSQIGTAFLADRLVPISEALLALKRLDNLSQDPDSEGFITPPSWLTNERAWQEAEFYLARLTRAEQAQLLQVTDRSYRQAAIIALTRLRSLDPHKSRTR